MTEIRSRCDAKRGQGALTLTNMTAPLNANKDQMGPRVPISGKARMHDAVSSSKTPPRPLGIWISRRGVTLLWHSVYMHTCDVARL